MHALLLTHNPYQLCTRVFCHTNAGRTLLPHNPCPPFTSSSMKEGTISCLAQGSSRGSVVAAGASFRVYYSLGAGTVPFVWETKPGTPRRTIDPVAATDDALPPITPPPLYQSKTMKKLTRKSSSCWPPRMMSWLNIRTRRRRPTATTGLHQTAASMINGYGGGVPSLGASEPGMDR
ncbi:hypothetical protein ACQJBY_000710 [Aegilops geniculata]